jgi:hypothetical protein
MQQHSGWFGTPAWPAAQFWARYNKGEVKKWRRRTTLSLGVPVGMNESQVLRFCYRSQGTPTQIAMALAMSSS